ncbi:hypothetical protein ACH5RR_034158 [Cinchona calisaya]|uniref:Uncharacterized protein n=1 Tax=Cinchona calisaya TaxID=153742 RepID=A0ABD2YEN1_9GENT
MGSSQAKQISESASTDHEEPPKYFSAIDELDKIYGFHPFSLKLHEKEVMNFIKSKFSQDLDEQLQQAISKDDQEAFSSFLNKASLKIVKDHQMLKVGSLAEVPLTNILSNICKSKALRCAEAFFGSDNIGFVDLDVKISWESGQEITPLNWAASELSGEFVKLFRRNFARVDESHLQAAIAALRNKLKWKRGESITKLISELRSSKMRNDLDTIGLLANNTKSVRRTFEVFIDDLSVDGVAILMIVDRNKILSLKCRQYVEKLCQKGQSSDQNDDLNSLKLLITMFEGPDSVLKFHQKRDKKVSNSGIHKKFKNTCKTFRSIHTKGESLESTMVGFSRSSDKLETKEVEENSYEKPTVGAPTYQNKQQSRPTSTFHGKGYCGSSTLVPNIQPFCGYHIQKSKFSTQSCGNADTLMRSLGRADKGFVHHILLSRRLASLALGIRRKTLFM